MKPFPLMREEKLDTQNGIANRRNVCHPPAEMVPLPRTLRIKANPITALIPAEFSQSVGEASK